MTKSTQTKYDSKTKKVCPRCHKIYTNYPAISRKDNKTYICSDCGQAEALEDFFNTKVG